MTASSFHEQLITAQYAHEGELILDEIGQKYRIQKREDLGHGVYLWKTGQSYPEFYLYDHLMTRFTYVPDPKPFKVYTRKYTASGDCIKGIKEFKTRKAQARYVTNAPYGTAVTFTN